MDVYIILKWIGLSLGIWGTISSFVLVYHACFWVNKFGRQNGIVHKNAYSWIDRVGRLAAPMWLALSFPYPRFDKIIRWLFAKDPINAQYLKLSPETLCTIRPKSLFFFIGIIAVAIGCIILKIMDSFGVLY